MSENKLRLVKELLESFKTNREVHEPFVMSFEEETDKALEWTVKQAKRVQELKEERDEWKDTAQSYYMTNQELREQNKRHREAIDYVMTAEITHYDSVEQLLADVKYVIEKTLEGEE